MEMMLACASHSPLIYFPGRESEGVLAMRAALADTRARTRAFDPELVLIFGCDHYGGHQMVSMPAFCIGVEATALADVGGFPGPLRVDGALAADAVNALRNDDVDVAVSYAMEVDHGFSQVLHELAGGIDAYPVLPIFVSCLQPPLVPFKRARALGAAVARFLAGRDLKRVLVLGTGGLSHNPSSLFPPIDEVSEQWKPYHLLGKRQSDVPQQTWIDYQIEMHRRGAQRLAESTAPLDAIWIREAWDRMFLDALCNHPLAAFDQWKPQEVIDQGGFGAMEVLSWTAAAETLATAAGAHPRVTFQQGIREVGVGFGIVEGGPVRCERLARPGASAA